MHIPKTPLSVPHNPFEAAMLDGSALCYLALANAGLGRSFDPLPKDSTGRGLAANLLGAGADLADAVAKSLFAAGLDPLAPHAAPSTSRHFGLARQMGNAGFEWAPLASIAMATGSQGAQRYWATLSPSELLSIAPTALPLACQAGNRPAVAALLGAGASPDTLDGEGRPAAGHARDAEVLAALLEAGADLRQAGKSLDGRPPRSTLDSILAEKSENSEAKALRALAVEWAASHPVQGELAGASLAANAFDALASGNKPAARSCILALGADANLHRNAQGESMAVAAAKNGNYQEVNRLLSLGADPYEACASGDSAWGLLLEARAWPLPGARYGQRVQAERLESILGALSTKRKYAAIPWARVGEGGHTLAESLLGRVGLDELVPLLARAESGGLDWRQPLSTGMDLPCALLAHRVFASARRHERFELGRDPERLAARAVAAALLERHSPQDSSPESKAAFARWTFDLWSRRDPHGFKNLPRHFLNIAIDTQFLKEDPAGRHSDEQRMAATLMEQGTLAAGRLGAALPIDSADRDALRTLFGSAPMERLFALFDQGALEGSLTRPAPSRLGARL